MTKPTFPSNPSSLTVDQFLGHESVRVILRLLDAVGVCSTSQLATFGFLDDLGFLGLNVTRQDALKSFKTYLAKAAETAGCPFGSVTVKSLTRQAFRTHSPAIFDADTGRRAIAPLKKPTPAAPPSPVKATGLVRVVPPLPRVQATEQPRSREGQEAKILYATKYARWVAIESREHDRQVEFGGDAQFSLLQQQLAATEVYMLLRNRFPNDGASKFVLSDHWTAVLSNSAEVVPQAIVANCRYRHPNVAFKLRPDWYFASAFEVERVPTTDKLAVLIGTGYPLDDEEGRLQVKKELRAYCERSGINEYIIVR